MKIRNCWSQYQAPTQRLKSQKTFLTTVKEVMKRLQLDCTNAPLRLAQVQCNLQLTRAVKKGITPEWELKAIALETIINRYPSPDWFHVYTDVSALEARHNAGAGVYSEAFQLSAPVGKISTNYDGELAEILLALDKVKRDPWCRIVVFV
uniref:RNase H type-1 domain-containing protein n=1 Tax=Rhodnius prolixus TaxID=13249 RepID=T1HW44_RHOPR